MHMCFYSVLFLDLLPPGQKLGIYCFDFFFIFLSGNSFFRYVNTFNLIQSGLVKEAVLSL